MMVPTIHLNGTSGEELVRQMSTLARSLRDVLQALQDATPHGRDYYPQDDVRGVCGQGAAFMTARQEHISRYNRIESVLNEVEAMQIALEEENDVRAARRGPVAPTNKE